MKWIDGVRLDSFLSGPPLTVGEVQRIGTALTEGLMAIHEQEIVHGDLHSANMMIGDCVVKIIDILYYDTLKSLSGASREAGGEYATTT